ncbi:hypothetical protein AB4099_13230 [Bosea sp. 2KB_26]|uniref:hypothetical protein n=1 Tax=Bosea sp. 2KB_26 TaxID=3237475 RepID=UPI003F918C70
MRLDAALRYPPKELCRTAKNKSESRLMFRPNTKIAPEAIASSPPNRPQTPADALQPKICPLNLTSFAVNFETICRRFLTSSARARMIGGTAVLISDRKYFGAIDHASIATAARPS